MIRINHEPIGIPRIIIKLIRTVSDFTGEFIHPIRSVTWYKGVLESCWRC